MTIFRRTREWGVRTPGLFGSVTWLGEGKSGKAEAEAERRKNPRLRVVQRQVKRKDKCRGGKCRGDFLCRKHFSERSNDSEFQLYDDKGRNLNTIRPDGEQA